MKTFQIDTTPIRNSSLNKFRQFSKGKEINYDFLNKYLHFGQLVDALITEPDKVDMETRVLNNVTRYESQKYQYNEYDFELALKMKEAFYNDPLARSIVSLASKHVFSNNEFEFQADEETKWILPTDGELDLAALLQRVGADVKMTTVTTQEEFNKKVLELHYDQQGAYYMDNAGIDKFVIIGISRKRKSKGGVDHKTGMQKVFHYTMTRGDKRYLNGKNRYSQWLKELVKYRVDNSEAKLKEVVQEVNQGFLPFFMEAS